MTIQDQASLRHAFGSFMTGVTVVTTTTPDGDPRGFTANSFTSVSLDPPLLLVCIAKTSQSLSIFTEAAGFGVNVLAEDQEAVSNTFARARTNRFDGVQWRSDAFGAVVLEGVSAWFICERHSAVDAGDHVILIGRIEAFEAFDKPGLGYARGRYVTGVGSRTLQGGSSHPRVKIGVIAENADGVLMVRNGEGWALPRAELSGGEGAIRCLDRLMGSLGVVGELDFPYAIYEAGDTQHLIFRCDAPGQSPTRGRFALPSALGADALDPADRGMLLRYEKERTKKEYGIFFGEAKFGSVRTIGLPSATEP